MRSIRRFDRSTTAMLLVLGVLAMLSCRSVVQTLVPRHRWSEEWGPMVPHETFPADCSLCHLPDRWDLLVEDFTFDHALETGFELIGGHRDAACLRCHNDRGPVEAYLARGCGGCHPDPHKSSLGMDCTRCHNEFTWRPDGLIAEHNQTRFPLVGSHAFAACESCHPRATSGDYRGAPVDCHFCHQREALLAQPNHVVNGWQRGCEECHDVSNWRAVRFDHSFFPLQGGHAGLSCNQCHVGGQVANTPNQCYDCHQNDYVATGTHVAGGFSTDCTQCHDIYAWN